MIISFNLVLAIAAATLLASLALAGIALASAWRTARRAASALANAELAQLRLADVETVLASCAGQLQELLAERERSNAVPARPSLRQAVALSRHGANTDELVATCRIGQSEARLIQMLYGSPKTAGEAQARDMH